MIDKDFLEKELKNRKTYKQIGKELNKSPDYIKYWAGIYELKSYRSYYRERKYEIEINKQIKHYIILDITPKILPNGKKAYLCECVNCGNKSYVSFSTLRYSKSNKCNYCCLQDIKRPDNYIIIPKSVWNRYKENAKRKREKEFSISKEYGEELYLKQNGKCALTGLNIGFIKRNRDKKRCYYMQASLDRIDSSKGYVEGNVQWVHKDVNMMKWALSQDRFIFLCKLIANNLQSGGVGDTEI